VVIDPQFLFSGSQQTIHAQMALPGVNEEEGIFAGEKNARAIAEKKWNMTHMTNYS